MNKKYTTALNRRLRLFEQKLPQEYKNLFRTFSDRAKFIISYQDQKHVDKYYPLSEDEKAELRIKYNLTRPRQIQKFTIFCKIDEFKMLAEKEWRNCQELSFIKKLFHNKKKCLVCNHISNLEHRMLYDINYHYILSRVQYLFEYWLKENDYCCYGESLQLNLKERSVNCEIFTVDLKEKVAWDYCIPVEDTYNLINNPGFWGEKFAEYFYKKEDKNE